MTNDDHRASDSLALTKVTSQVWLDELPDEEVSLVDGEAPVPVLDDAVEEGAGAAVSAGFAVDVEASPAVSFFVSDVESED